MSIKKKVKEERPLIPLKYRRMVGTDVEMSGGLFSGKVKLPPAIYSVVGIRWGSANIYDVKKRREVHPTFELLVQGPSMKRSRWTRPFPIREIKL